MRAREFITELKLDIPNQMVTVQLPLSDLVTANDDEDVDTVKVNPGKRAGHDGRYKWSPPLQQHLDSVKDSVGPSNDDIVADPETSPDQEEPQQKPRSNNIAVRTITPSVLG